MTATASGWRAVPLKHLVQARSGATPSTSNLDFWDDDDGLPWVAIGDMSGTESVRTTAKRVTEDAAREYRLPFGDPGTLLFAMYASVGETSILETRATWNQAILGLTPRNSGVDGKFLYYALRSLRPSLVPLFRSNTQNNLNAEQVGNLRLLVPGLETQRVIAEFLDRETAQIDAMIGAQQRLVDLLAERRRSRITEVVTSGLDQTANVDTGLDWLGAVPSLWQVVPAKAAFALRNEKSRAQDVHLTPSQQHGVMPQDEYMELTGNKVVLNLSGADNMRHVEPDDFIIHLRSFQGGIEHSRHRGKVSMAYTVLVPRSGVVAEYFKWVLKSATYIQALQTTTNQLRDGQSIRYSEFATIPLPLPPEAEQRAIADFLSHETARIEQMIRRGGRLIQLLRERRAALITAAVTGRLDPRTGIEELDGVMERVGV